MDSRHFSRQTKRTAFKRANGHCESCGIKLPVGGGGIHYDHRIPWAISQDSSIANASCLCVRCHLDKTARKDIPDIARVERLADARMGIRRVSKPLPGGRDSAISISFRGPVKRKTQAERYRETMAKRQIGVVE